MTIIQHRSRYTTNYTADLHNIALSKWAANCETTSVDKKRRKKGWAALQKVGTAIKPAFQAARRISQGLHMTSCDADSSAPHYVLYDSCATTTPCFVREAQQKFETRLDVLANSSAARHVLNRRPLRHHKAVVLED